MPNKYVSQKNLACSATGERFGFFATARRNEISYDLLGSIAEIIDVLVVNFGRRGIPRPGCAISPCGATIPRRWKLNRCSP